MRNSICVASCPLKKTDMLSDVTYNVLVGYYSPLCYNTSKGEPQGLMRESFCASIRCALKTTKEPSDVSHNVLVGCYIPVLP